MKRGAFLITTLALVGCGGGNEEIVLGEEGKLIRDMAEIVGIFGSAKSSFRWTDLHDRIAYDLKRGKSPREIVDSLLEKESNLNTILNEKIYLSITYYLSNIPYIVKERDIEISLVSCSWILNENLNRKVDSLLQKNKYEAIEYMETGLRKFLYHILSSKDSLAPLKAERAAMAYSCFYAMAELFGKVELTKNMSLLYGIILAGRPDIAKMISEYGKTEEKK